MLVVRGLIFGGGLIFEILRYLFGFDAPSYNVAKTPLHIQLHQGTWLKAFFRRAVKALILVFGK